MQHLERLEMQYCDLADATDLYPLMARARLRRLDVGYNELRVFNPPDFGAVQTLDLRYNHLTAWPGRVFEAPQLHSLDLSGNELTHIPGELFNGEHERLIQGTNLSENRRLSLSALQDMRRYAREQSALHVLGMSRRNIETMIDTHLFGDLFGGAEPVGIPEDAAGNVDLDDPDAAVLPVEEVLDPVNDVAPRSRDPWLQHSDVTLAARRADIWGQLAREPDHQRFFQLLRLLRDTDDFRLVPADLTRRMWDVMQAATENSELRQLLFLGAESHGTCPDGRILTFSDLEVRVSVYRALHDIPVHRMALRGRALLRLSRQLFRLDRIETLADAAGRGRDRAEVRLKYRIGLTGGWGDGVDLPGQPTYMLYDVPLSGELLNQTRASILEAERTDALPLSMIARDYWITYLEERLPLEMQAIDSAVDQQRQERWSVLDDRLSRGEIDARQYDRELEDLGKAMERLLTQKRLELTRREIIDLQSFADEAEEGDRVTPKPGPSSRP
ncbi:Leucine Rich Repeat protein [compost metagenome]